MMIYVYRACLHGIGWIRFCKIQCGRSFLPSVNDILGYIHIPDP